MPLVAKVAELVAIEPTLAEVTPHAQLLSAAYNDPQNAPLLGHDAALSEAEVLEHYEGLLDAGAHPFLFFVDGALAGDGDLRGIEGGAAELAFLVAAPSMQGKGLGTRFATMLHAFAFRQLGLERVYASIVPANVASRRVFEKLGCSVDESEAARAYADDESDIMMSIDRATFERLNAEALSAIAITLRARGPVPPPTGRAEPTPGRS